MFLWSVIYNLYMYNILQTKWIQLGSKQDLGIFDSMLKLTYNSSKYNFSLFSDISNILFKQIKLNA